MPTKKRAIICDIDGTVARFDPTIRTPYEHEKSDQDLPHQHVIDLLNIIRFGATDVDILMVSGRYDKHREITYDWLQKHKVPFNRLFMRDDDDNRPDNIVKMEIYTNNIEKHYDILFVLDDRNRVVDMWRKVLKLPCFQVAEGDF